MSPRTLKEIYEAHVKPLPVGDRLQLLSMTAQDLSGELAAARPKAKRSILELRGLGKEIWANVEPQQYVDELRNEWS